MLSLLLLLLFLLHLLLLHVSFVYFCSPGPHDHGDTKRCVYAFFAETITNEFVFLSFFHSSSFYSSDES